MDIKDNVINIMKEYLNVYPMKQKKSAWIKLESKMRFVPVDYAYYFVEYQNLYFSAVYKEYQDISVVIYDTKDEEAIGIWPLCIYVDKNDNTQVGSIGGDVLAPLLLENLNDPMEICGGV